MPTKINYTEDAEFSMNLVGNDANCPSSLHFFTPKADSVALVISCSGKIVFEDHFNSRPGHNQVPLRIKDLSEGNYEVALLTSNKICRKRFRLN